MILYQSLYELKRSNQRELYSIFRALELKLLRARMADQIVTCGNFIAIRDARESTRNCVARGAVKSLSSYDHTVKRALGIIANLVQCKNTSAARARRFIYISVRGHEQRQRARGAESRFYGKLIEG